MAKSININKANFTQLKASKKIGETSALAIIAKREEEGLLNLDNLKDISEIPQSLWTALLSENIICLEDPEDADEGQEAKLQQKETLIKVEKVIADKEEKSGPVQLLKGKYNAKVHKNSDYDGPTAPKMSTYDGKNDWRPYYLQFSTIANRYKWQSEQKLYKLIECLRDKALKFYSSRPKLVKTNYESLCKKMEERFGRKEPPHIMRRLLQDLKQDQEESLEEFAERAQELATDGYPDTPDRFVQTLATYAFLKGCVDKRAALTAMDKNPDSLDQAVQHVRSAVANQKVIMGTRRTEIKRVSFMEQNDANEDIQETSVRALMKSEEGANKMNIFEKRLQKTEDDL
ncbi:unnamed protein product [Mytilus coruscus]|uniref:Retrotransposon gag domain-containing protein n=1 Tax=Mytilus coruscus TaxID=42192 RepID=A0A6J8E1S0_MYTCO|nr:unnamed protein product [Mytilus coruscus]